MEGGNGRQGTAYPGRITAASEVTTILPMSTRARFWLILAVTHALAAASFALVLSGHQSLGIMLALAAFVVGGIGRRRETRP